MIVFGAAPASAAIALERPRRVVKNAKGFAAAYVFLKSGRRTAATPADQGRPPHRCQYCRIA
jgi:hypothetical protein